MNSDKFNLGIIRVPAGDRWPTDKGALKPLKMVKVANFMLCIIYLNLPKKKRKKEKR